MTLPKGWKKEQPTTKKETSSEQKEQSSSKIEKTSSTIITVDNKNIDEWTNSWTDDGVWSTPFGEAKGKTELKNMINQVTDEFASGKRHLSTNIIIEDAP